MMYENIAKPVPPIIPGLTPALKPKAPPTIKPVVGEDVQSCQPLYPSKFLYKCFNISNLIY